MPCGYHALAPPVVDHALADLCAGAVETVKRAGGHVAEELCAIARKCRAKPVEYLIGRPAGFLAVLTMMGGTAPALF
jgi:hypothetical protein